MADKPTSITALCPVCGTTSRFHGSGEILQPADVLTCESCGLKLSYAFLQTRMPEQAQVEPPKRTKTRKKPAAKKKTPPRQ
jgi:hypothetical protein